MNLAEISEEFGEQITAITAGTKYEINSESNKDVPVMEARIRNSMYCLWKDASAKSLAVYLQKTSEQYFQELYEFSYGVTTYTEDIWLMKGTERIALMIVAEKENRKRQIERLKHAYERFTEIMGVLSIQDAELLKQYFLHREKVDYETLRAAIKRNLTTIEAYYDSDTEDAEQRTKEISADIEGPAPKIKNISTQQSEKNKKRAQNDLLNLFK